MNKPDETGDSAYTDFMQDYPAFQVTGDDIALSEGCTDSFVYPGGSSGPTISCGLDIGNASSQVVRNVTKWILNDDDRYEILDGTTIRGAESVNWIRHHQIHIGKHTAARLCSQVKRYYWKALVTKYPNMENAPDEVKAAMLDLTFQAGIDSKRLDGFKSAINKNHWKEVGVLVSNSYNDLQGGRFNSVYHRRVSHGIQIQYKYDPPKNIQRDYD